MNRVLAKARLDKPWTLTGALAVAAWSWCLTLAVLAISHRLEPHYIGAWHDHLPLWTTSVVCFVVDWLNFQALAKLAQSARRPLQSLLPRTAAVVIVSMLLAPVSLALILHLSDTADVYGVVGTRSPAHIKQRLEGVLEKAVFEYSHKRMQQSPVMTLEVQSFQEVLTSAFRYYLSIAGVAEPPEMLTRKYSLADDATAVSVYQLVQAPINLQMFLLSSSTVITTVALCVLLWVLSAFRGLCISRAGVAGPGRHDGRVLQYCRHRPVERS
jgi:hypothetical protein